jgi:hypothetical protein
MFVFRVGRGWVNVEGNSGLGLLGVLGFGVSAIAMLLWGEGRGVGPLSPTAACQR